MYHFRYVERRSVSPKHGIPEDAVFDLLGDKGFALMSPPLLETLRLPIRKGNLSQGNWEMGTFVLLPIHLTTNLSLPEGCCVRDDKLILVVSRLC